VFARRLAEQGSTWAVVSRTSDPDRALAHLLARDALFTDRLRADCARLGLPVLEVGTGVGEDAATTRVELLLGL
jgi:NAD(P)-dependent dehydrogenase (short-subunit alcohol dehydrogenase family)